LVLVIKHPFSKFRYNALKMNVFQRAVLRD